jgi:hypothetical protein
MYFVCSDLVTSNIAILSQLTTNCQEFLNDFPKCFHSAIIADETFGSFASQIQNAPVVVQLFGLAELFGVTVSFSFITPSA